MSALRKEVDAQLAAIETTMRLGGTPGYCLRIGQAAKRVHIFIDKVDVATWRELTSLCKTTSLTTTVPVELVDWIATPPICKNCLWKVSKNGKTI